MRHVRIITVAVVAVVASIAYTAAPLARGISGLQLGAKPSDVHGFKLGARENPVAKLLAKYGKPDAAKEEARKAREVGREFYVVTPAGAKFSEGVSSADVETFQNVTCQIGLHYDEQAVKARRWRGIAAEWLGKLGKPTKDSGSGYVWDDGRTRIDLELSGSSINLFFTDVALELELKRAERDAT